MLKAFVMAFSLFVISINGEDITSLLVSSNGEITQEIREIFLAEKKADMLKAASDSGFAIRASTISYIDNSKYLYEAVYGTFSKTDPHIIRNLDSLLIYAENDGNATFWDTRHNLLLGAAIGRRGFGVGEHKVFLQNDLKPALKGEHEYLASARKEGLTYGEWLEKEFNNKEKAIENRKNKYAKLYKDIQDTLLSWVGKVNVQGVGARQSWYGYNKSGLLKNDRFMYAQVMFTDSLKPKLNKMLTAAGYTGKLFTALDDVKEIYSPDKKVYNNQMAVYEYFKELVTWQETPKEKLNWNPELSQAAIDKMVHPTYRVSKAPWQPLTLISRSFRKNELEWVRQNYLGYISHKDKSDKDTTQVYIPSVIGYGPYRKKNLEVYRLVAYPIAGYVKLCIVGGVCGTCSSVGQQVGTAFGRPIYKAGQPGHSCTVGFSLNGEKSFVSPGQTIASKELTTSMNILWDTKSTFMNGIFLNTLGLAYGINISEESWITSRIAYSLWQEMEVEEKEMIGMEMMTKALEKNGGYTEAVCDLFRFCQKREDSLFTATYQRIVDGIDLQKKKYESGTKMYIQCAEYKDLLTFHFIERAFKNNTYWPVSSTNGLVKWLESFILKEKLPVKGTDYKNQSKRLWNISTEAKKAKNKTLSSRPVMDVRIIPPALKEGVAATGERNGKLLIDGSINTRYRTIIGKDVAKDTPYDFTFIFDDVYPVQTMQMYHYTKNGTVTQRAKDYELYWSLDSNNWEGPIKGQFTKDKYQSVHFDPDTTFIPEDTVPVIDSNGIVVDSIINPPETLVVANAVKMKYVKYVPKSTYKEDPFIGILAQEFWFYYEPDFSVSVTTNNIQTKNVIRNSQGISIPGITNKQLNVINVKGQIIDRIDPQQLGNRVHYPLSSSRYGKQVVILEFPTELKMKPVKLSR